MTFFYRYTTDDRDLPLEAQRDLVVSKDKDENIWVDVVPVGENSTHPVILLKEKPSSHDIYVALDAIHSLMEADAHRCSSFIDYQSLKEEVLAWRHEFGDKDSAPFPQYVLSTPSLDASVLLYSDDTQDHSNKRLKILLGGNQDWYVSASSTERKDFRGVRLCTSGGASDSLPGLVFGISEIYRMLLNPSSQEGSSPAYASLYQEVMQWRNTYPERRYEYGFISD